MRKIKRFAFVKYGNATGGGGHSQCRWFTVRGNSKYFVMVFHKDMLAKILDSIVNIQCAVFLVQFCIKKKITSKQKSDSKIEKVKPITHLNLIKNPDSELIFKVCLTKSADLSVFVVFFIKVSDFSRKPFCFRFVFSYYSLLRFPTLVGNLSVFVLFLLIIILYSLFFFFIFHLGVYS